MKRCTYTKNANTKGIGLVTEADLDHERIVEVEKPPMIIEARKTLINIIQEGQMNIEAMKKAMI